MCDRLNLCAIFWEGDLVNGAGAHESKVTRNAPPEAQECSCSGTSLRRCRLGAALRWTLLLRFGINVRHVITAVIAFGTVGRVAVVGAGNKNRARIGDECAKLPESCMRLRCGKVKNLSTNLRVRAGGIAGCFSINEWTGATR